MTYEELASYLLGDTVPVDPGAIAEVERKAQATLPEDYRAFLAIRNGGMTSPTAIEQEPLFSDCGHHIEHFYCATLTATDWNVPSIRNYKVMPLCNWLDETGRNSAQVPAHWIVFGGNWDGEQFALDLSKPGGEVCWLDHELLPTDDDGVFPEPGGIVRSGHSFGTFVAGLGIGCTATAGDRPIGLLDWLGKLLKRPR